MKVIVSHDVDHLTFWEHSKDLIIPKFFIRNAIECLHGHIQFSEALKRSGVIFNNRWHRLPELMAFDIEKKLPSTFFFGVNNGCNLAYSLRNAETWIHYAIEKGFDVGVHGIGYQNFEEIQREFSTLKSISGKSQFGIRMHYLRQNDDTINHLSRTGYLFDSTIRATPANILPYKAGEMWELPLHIMDGDIIECGKRYGNKSLKEAQALTSALIDNIFEKQTEYLTILFHDRYFDDSFSIWRDWYIWVVEYLKSSEFEFIGYPQAVKELNNRNSTLSR